MADTRKKRPERHIPHWDESMPRPLCKCHSQPMVRNGTSVWSGGIKWQCRVSNRQRVAANITVNIERHKYKCLRNTFLRRMEYKRQQIAELEASLAEEE